MSSELASVCHSAWLPTTRAKRAILPPICSRSSPRCLVSASMSCSAADLDRPRAMLHETCASGASCAVSKPSPLRTERPSCASSMPSSETETATAELPFALSKRCARRGCRHRPRRRCAATASGGKGARHALRTQSRPSPLRTRRSCRAAWQRAPRGHSLITPRQRCGRRRGKTRCPAPPGEDAHGCIRAAAGPSGGEGGPPLRGPGKPLKQPGRRPRARGRQGAPSRASVTRLAHRLPIMRALSGTCPGPPPPLALACGEGLQNGVLYRPRAARGTWPGQGPRRAHQGGPSGLRSHRALVAPQRRRRPSTAPLKGGLPHPVACRQQGT